MNPWDCTNRLIRYLLLGGLFCLHHSIHAQVQFSFNYTGPTTLIAGPDCRATLDWGDPNTLTASCIDNSGGACSIQSLTLQSISGGYNLGDLVPAGETLDISYLAVSSIMGADSLFVFQLSVIDTLGPVFSAADLTEECGNNDDQLRLNTWILDRGGAVLVDTCNRADWLNFDYRTVDGQSGLGISFDSLHLFPEILEGDCDWEVSVSFRAEDNWGNVDISTAVFRLEDTERPLLLGIPVDQVADCDGVPPPPQIGTAISAIDNCDTLLTISFSESSSQSNNGTCTDYNYSLTRTWSVTDDCGNTATGSQNISVLDLSPPGFTAPADITLNCNQSILPEVSGWPTAISDNCDAQPDTLFSDVFTAGNCTNNYSITRVWTIRDACSNTSTAQVQQITVRDTSRPTFVNPAIDTEVSCADPVANEQAFQDWLANRGGATAIDNCSPNNQLRWYAAVPGSYVLSDSLSILPPGTLDAPNCPSTEPMIYQEESVDFIVYDECGNARVSRATFRIKDEIPPAFDNCPQDSSITVNNSNCELAFELPLPQISEACDTSGFLTVAYSIDDGTRVPFDLSTAPIAIFSAGQHRIRYFATDCTGNESECSYQLTVVDILPPQITCPADTVLLLSATDDCAVGINIDLPLPVQIEDNCGFASFAQTQPSSATEAALSFSYNTTYDDYIADDKQFRFIGTAANAAGNSVELLITIGGDIDEVEEYFSLYDEEGRLLGTTEIGQPDIILNPGDCQADPPQAPLLEARFSINTADFNRWAADGAVDFELRANTSFATPPPGNPGDGISPLCTPFAPGTTDGSTDGLSFVNLSLSYQQVLPAYYIEGASPAPLTPMVPPVVAPNHTFLPGTSTVHYIVEDLEGNRDTCRFDVTVEDPLPPEALCQPATIFVHPSGAIPYVLTPAEVDGGSSDNCRLDSLFLSQDTFICDLARGTYDIQLYAVDETGNLDSCTAQVRVEVAPPEPTFSIGLCGNDTLYLFANAPAPPPGVVYTYAWTGPQGFMSTDADPIIPGATALQSGSYAVSITGLSGCSSVGTVEVFISPVPNTPQLNVNSNALCANDELILSTQQYSGAQVNYEWYTGVFPGGTLITTTSVSTLTIFPPLTTDTYYVIVDVDGCSSGGSFFERVDITAVPTASTSQAVINICEGENIQLGTSVAGPGLSYEWTGPDGFSSIAQNPMQIMNAGLAKAGVYSLVISENGCTSIPAQTLVSIRPQPQPPQLSTSGLGCAGESITLSASPATADVYTWTSPIFNTQITTANSLTLNNVTMADAGAWTVTATVNGCESESSAPVTVFVEPLPLVIAANNGPGCEGGTIELSANTIPGATYSWSGPNGFNAIGQEVTTPAIAGTYVVLVSSSLGCQTAASTQVSINAPPRITALSSTSLACVDGNTPIELIATIFPPDDGSYTYQWNGPNGYSSTDSLPTLPAGTSTDNGTYTLIVTNGAGCSSMPISTLVNLKDIPVQPLISGPALVCEGQALTLNTQNYTGTQLFYEWNTPLGNFTTLIPSLTINPTSPANSGSYTVAVTVEGCRSEFSAPIQVNVSSSLPLPVVQSNSPVCEGETIELSTSTIPGADYSWTGPDNFSADTDNPMIFDAQLTDAGMYTVQLMVNGCSSPVSLPVNVVVNPQPTTPELDNNGPICIDAPGAFLNLSVNPGSAMPGASYTWFWTQNDQQIGGPGAATQLLITDFSDYGEGVFDFYAIATVNGCSSDASVPTSVTLNEIPAIDAFAGDDANLCNEDMAILNADAPMTGTGSWTQLSGPVVDIADSSAANTMISGLQAGNTYRFSWSLSFGACVDYATDEVTLTVYDNQEVAAVGPALEICNQDTLTLTANGAGQDNIGIWTQPAAQALAGVNIENPNDPQTLVSGLQDAGTYSFTWTLSNPGCGDFSSDQLDVTLIENIEEAQAGDDFTDCGDGELFLMATPPLNGIGSWTSTDPTLLITDPNDPDSRVEGLDNGDYLFIWTLDKGVCGLSRDTVRVSYELGPQAVDDVVEVPFARNISFDVSDNDRLPVDGAVTIVLETMPVHGTVRNSGDGNFIYEPDPLYAGVDSFSYSLCSSLCIDDCSSAWVRLTVGGAENCTAPTIFTPNNDMINDAFVVPCLATDRYPNNRVVIFNQWGDEVFKAAPYFNDWMGTYNGEDLPAGTYFYVIEFGDGREAPLSNFLVLER
ncbi:MAG: gliding motility-associated C-terminal domain-containing protein [Bacteroidota bacterium]